MDEIIDGMWVRQVDVFCDGCGAAIPENMSPFSLRDGKLLCPNCVRRVRIRFPKTGEVDPLRLLTLPDYLREREEIGAYRENLRQRYEGADAVFITEEVKKKGSLLSAPTWRVYGRVIYGKFYPGELVLSRNGGKEKMVKLREIYAPSNSFWMREKEAVFLRRPAGRNREGKAAQEERKPLLEAIEGLTYELVLRERGLNLFPGDLFLKKDKWKGLAR